MNGATGRKVSIKARALEGTETFGFASTGTRQVGFRVEGLSGGEGFTGEVFSWYGYFTDTSGKRTLESLKTAGWKDDDDGWRGFGNSTLPGLGSTEFELQLEEEEEEDAEGNPAGTYWRPTFINKIGVAMKEQMDAGTIKAFAAEMRAMFGGPPTAPAGRQRGAAAPTTAPSTTQQRGGAQQRGAAPQQRSPAGQSMGAQYPGAGFDADDPGPAGSDFEPKF